MIPNYFTHQQTEAHSCVCVQERKIIEMVHCNLTLCDVIIIQFIIYI